MIQVDEYKFSARKASGPKKIWRCSSHSKWGCRAKIYTIDDQIVRIVGTHEHVKYC